MEVMTFEEWINYKALVLGGAPAWFKDATECERRYQSYRDAFEGSCTTANPMDVALTPNIPPAHVIHTVSQPQTPRTTPRTQESTFVVARLWAIAFALLVQIAIVAGPALAGETDIVVNGRVLAAHERTQLESVVGPLQPGAYWAHENGDFGEEGSDEPSANIRTIVQQRMKAARILWQRQQQAQRNAMMMQMMQNAMRQRQAQGGYAYGNRFSSGQRYSNGSWSHYNGYSNYGVGGTANGCVYTPNWSNC